MLCPTPPNFSNPHLELRSGRTCRYNDSAITKDVNLLDLIGLVEVFLTLRGKRLHLSHVRRVSHAPCSDKGPFAASFRTVLPRYQPLLLGFTRRIHIGSFAAHSYVGNHGSSPSTEHVRTLEPPFPLGGLALCDSLTFQWSACSSRCG